MTTASVAASVASRAWAPVTLPTGGSPPEVTLVSQYDLDSGSAVDSVGGIDGTVVGTWNSFEAGSLVQGISGTSFYKEGNTAKVELPASQAAHDLSNLTFGFYFQPSANTDKHILFTSGGSDVAGDFSIERLTNGRLRGWHVGSDGGLRFFESTDGVAGTNLEVGTAYRIVITFGPSGTRLYLNGTEVSSIPQNTNGWNNARVKTIGVWPAGDIDGFEGAFDHLRIWDGEMSSTGVAALEPASSTTLPPPSEEPVGSSSNLPYFGQYYGNASMGHNAANLSGNETITFFFYAERTGTLDRIRFHYRTGSGYSSGDGGTYNIKIVEAVAADENDPFIGKEPVTPEVVIAEVTAFQGGNPGESQQHIDIPFDVTGEVTEKEPYCVVFEETSGAGHASYNICLQHLFDTPLAEADYEEPPSPSAGIDPAALGSSPGSVQGWTPVKIDGTRTWYPWTVCRRGGSFSWSRVGPPMIEMRYDDGQWVGWGSWGGGSGHRFTISGNDQFREHFRVSRADRIVSGVFIRIARLNSSGGNLVVTLEEGPVSDTSGNGTQIEQVTVPATTVYDVGASWHFNWFNDGRPADGDVVPYLWVPFSESRKLVKGTIYSIRFHQTGGGSYEVQCSARGEPNFSPGSQSLTWDQWETQRTVPWTAWEDSRDCQTSLDGGTSWSFFIGNLSPVLFKSAAPEQGLSTQFPGDTNILSHPSVLLHENWEAGNLDQWVPFTDSQGSTNFTTTPAEVHSGTQALEIVLGQSTGDAAVSFTHTLSQQHDLLFVRYYIRFDPLWDLGPDARNHNGIGFQACDPVNDCPPAGTAADGTNKYQSRFEADMRNKPLSGNSPHYDAPGRMILYTAHANQPGPFSEIMPPDEDDPSLLTTGRWYSIEMMLKANDVGQANGELKGWIDGVLVQHETGITFRTVSDLRMDRIRGTGFIHENTARTNRIWMDDIVVATEYIGPQA